MQDWNKKNWILLAVLAGIGLTVFFTYILLWYANSEVGGGLWSAPLPVAAIGYGIYTYWKKLWPLTKDNKEDEK